MGSNNILIKIVLTAKTTAFNFLIYFRKSQFNCHNDLKETM